MPGVWQSYNVSSIHFKLKYCVWSFSRSLKLPEEGQWIKNWEFWSDFSHKYTILPAFLLSCPYESSSNFQLQDLWGIFGNANNYFWTPRNSLFHKTLPAWYRWISWSKACQCTKSNTPWVSQARPKFHPKLTTSFPRE